MTLKPYPAAHCQRTGESDPRAIIAYGALIAMALCLCLTGAAVLLVR